MLIVHTIAELRSAIGSMGSIGFVPTMGNLHQGHLDLVKIAKHHAETVVVSIFVNPLQFGANEDFGSYPRTLQADCEKLAGLADIVFAPNVDEMYPDFDGQNLNQTMTITPPPLAETLCGASRPGHFSGVATVVLKLFNIVRPQIAVFGKKDFQQLRVIQALVRQFNMPIEIIAAETTREADGLAMSSRNGYLTAEQRAKAPQLYRELQKATQAIRNGTPDFRSLEAEIELILSADGWVVDYIAVRSSSTLAPALNVDKNLVVLGAARLGNTRLIDNIECKQP